MSSSNNKVQQQPIRCSAPHAGTPPLAKKACLSCSQYLCAACDAKQHSADSERAKHYRFEVSKLKSYIVFNGPKPQGETHIRRHLSCTNGPVCLPLSNGAITMYEAVHHAMKQYSSALAFGHRTVSASGQVGVYTFTTFKEVAMRINNFANGLAHLGLEQNSRIGLYSSNRGEWNVAEYACYNFAYIPVPLYDTLGPEAAEHIIRQASIEVVVASEEKLASLQKIAQSNPQLKAIVVMTRLPYEAKITTSVTAQAPPATQVRVYSFTEMERLGASKPKLPHTPPTPKSICTLCYTSGTTGVPKGAILTHENMMSNIASINQLENGLDIGPGDVHISYLPLAHMFERSALAMNFFNGSCVAYSRGNPLLLLEDVMEARPTIFVGVPRLYNRLYDKVLATIDESGGVKKWLFHTAYGYKLGQLRANGALRSTIFDRVVFKKISEKLGGRVRLFITGSAPISDNVMTFLRVAFSAPVVEGYGQTEATTAVTLTAPFDHAVGNVGSPLICNELKLVDVVEMNYRSTDVDAGGVPMPRGEICSRGPNIFSGYYKDTEKTAEALDSEAWLHSGDIGTWLPDGTLKIIDRKKNIFKLSQGEYIAPEKCENIYLRSKLVAQCLVHGDSLQSCLVGIVVPDEEILVAWAKKSKQPITNFKQLCTQASVKQMILDDMNLVAEQGKLASFEQVKDIRIASEPWTVENDLLTPSLKLKRDAARKKFQKEIDEMYAALATAASEKKALQQQAKQQIKSKL